MAGLTCHELVELVTDYLEGALSDDEVGRFEEHLAVCPGCQTYLDQMRETAALLGDVPAVTLPEGMTADLLTALRDYRRA